jgi:hypothetical protein
MQVRELEQCGKEAWLRFETVVLVDLAECSNVLSLRAAKLRVLRAAVDARMLGARIVVVAMKSVMAAYSAVICLTFGRDGCNAGNIFGCLCDLSLLLHDGLRARIDSSANLGRQIGRRHVRPRRRTRLRRTTAGGTVPQ